VELAHLFIKVPRLGGSEVTFSVFESSQALETHCTEFLKIMFPDAAIAAH